VSVSLATAERGIASVLARAGDRAARELGSGDLARLVHEVDGLVPGNGVDDSFADVTRLLATAEVVDVFGRPGGIGGIYAALAEARDGARMLTVLRDGARRDVAAEQFFTDVARAAGLEDYVAPMATASDGSFALVQLMPHPDLRALDVGSADELEHAIARGLVNEGASPLVARHEALVDRELVASLDAITEHADRHPGNALLDASTGRLTLIDHELIGGGGYYAYEYDGLPLLDRFMQGGSRGRTRLVEGERVTSYRVNLDDDSIAQLAEVDPAAVRAAHDRLAAAPLPARIDEMAEWIRSPEYGDRVVNNLRRVVDDGGWSYDPARM
jgi:hypothetical protein